MKVHLNALTVETLIYALLVQFNTYYYTYPVPKKQYPREH